MGFFKNALKASFNKALKQTIQQYQPKQETVEERIVKEKQKIANDIRVLAKEQADNHLKIVRDCVELVNTTVNPDVFFKRYDLLLVHLEELAKFEGTGIFDNSRELPSATFLRVDEQFDSATNDFLDRSFEDAKKHAETLKTENGKRNAINRYFENMEKYISYMSEESLEYFNKMKEANKN
jgi:hypothetical protein